MAYKYKEGDRVILGKHIDNIEWSPLMDRFVGREALLNRGVCYNRHSWYVIMLDGTHNVYYWHENVMKLIGCPCRVNNCLKHRRQKS